MTGTQYSNITDSILTLVPVQASSDFLSWWFYSIPLDGADQPKPLSVPMIPGESIPSTFPTVYAPHCQSYFFTTLVEGSSNATDQMFQFVRLHTLGLNSTTVHIVGGLELFPKVSYISMLAYDISWDCLVGLLGYSDTEDSLPAWVSIDYRTGKVTTLLVRTNYEETNVFSSAYDQVAHEFHFILQTPTGINKLTTVSLADGAVFSSDLHPDSSSFYYGGLFWQDPLSS